MLRRPWIVSLALLLAVAVVPFAVGDAGDLDTSFDGDGKAITDFGKSEFAKGMAIQRDGKIVVVGLDTETDPPRYYRDFVLARYQRDGSLDPAFGGGRVRTDFAGFSDAAEGVVQQPDGKLLVGGWSGQQLAFARYNADASLDSTFDGDGKTLVSVGPASGSAHSVALQADGRVVAAGEVCGAGAPSCDFVLARLNSGGSLDTTFDGDGLAITDLSGTQEEDVGTSIAVQPDGKIVAAGYAYPSRDVLLARYDANGSLDASFDGDGKVRTPLSCCALWPRLAVQADRKILVATGGHLLRYNANGSLDPRFGAGGVVSATANTIEAATLQPDGKVVVAGSPRDVAKRGVVVSRYAKDGSYDPNFNSILVSVETWGPPVAAVGLQSDHKIVVAGDTGPDAGHLDFIVLRFLNPAPPQPRCRVPNVRGKALGVARRSIRRARCSVGNVSRKRSRSVRKGRVISQSPRPGRLVPLRSKVKLVVSRGPAR
jgi:uncharacterized delta-60 repeat protein